jgi:hypothetical protein
VQATYSPAVQRLVPTSTTSPPTTSAPAPHAAAAAPPPAVTPASGAAPKQPPAAAAHGTRNTSAHHPKTKNTASTTPANTTPATAPGDIPGLDEPLDAALAPLATSPVPNTLGRSNANAIAIDPQDVSSRGESSTQMLLLTLFVCTGAVALALALIRRDVRRLVPVRPRHSRQRFGGPISAVTQSPAVRTNDTVSDLS